MEYTSREFVDCHECGLAVPYDTLVDIDGDKYCHPCGTSILHLLAQEQHARPFTPVHPGASIFDSTPDSTHGPHLV